MKLWHLVRNCEAGWEEYQSMVVRAETELAARDIAGHAEDGDRGVLDFLDPSKSTCDELTTEGPSEIIISDFVNG